MQYKQFSNTFSIPSIKLDYFKLTNLWKYKTTNRYGHPTQETLAKLNAMSVKVYRTDLNGTVIITSDGSNISVRAER